jgi:antitoxin component YwqK of YwqJK toxin-antitoxin module
MRVNFDDTDMDDGLRTTYQGEWFTGEVVETDHAGNVTSLATYVNGREDGLSQEWYADGTLHHRGTVKRGIAVGTQSEWHPNGQLAKQLEFDDHGRQLSRRLWDPAGNLLEEHIYRR